MSHALRPPPGLEAFGPSRDQHSADTARKHYEAGRRVSFRQSSGTPWRPDDLSHIPIRLPGKFLITQSLTSLVPVSVMAAALTSSVGRIAAAPKRGRTPSLLEAGFVSREAAAWSEEEYVGMIADGSGTGNQDGEARFGSGVSAKHGKRPPEIVRTSDEIAVKKDREVLPGEAWLPTRHCHEVVLPHCNQFPSLKRICALLAAAFDEAWCRSLERQRDLLCQIYTVCKPAAKNPRHGLAWAPPGIRNPNAGPRKRKGSRSLRQCGADRNAVEHVGRTSSSRWRSRWNSQQQQLQQERKRKRRRRGKPHAGRLDPPRPPKRSPTVLFPSWGGWGEVFNCIVALRDRSVLARHLADSLSSSFSQWQSRQRRIATSGGRARARRRRGVIRVLVRSYIEISLRWLQTGCLRLSETPVGRSMCEGCLVVGCDHGPQAEVAQGVRPEPLVEH